MKIAKRVRVWLGVSVLAVATATVAQAQGTMIPNLDQYAKGATSSTNVTLDKNMLGMASGFMDKKDKDQAQAKNVISKLNGIYVHTFQYDKDWAYDRKSVAETRKLFSGAEWSNIVSQHSANKDGDTDIWMHMVNGNIQGMMIITAEPRELTFVEIDGQLKPEDLHQLQGSFGIPPPLPPSPPAKPGKAGKSSLEAEPLPIPGAFAPVAEAPPAMPADPRPMLSYSGHPSPPALPAQ